VGSYRCIYSENVDVIVDAILRIEPILLNETLELPNSFHFTWEVGQDQPFRGIGYLLRENQVVVNYWNSQ